MEHADALIIGAGPAGSAAAITLATGGLRVALVDRCDFPRDKICGDALIPDALAALDRLGLRTPVLARARRLNGIRVYAPSGRSLDIAGVCASLPRAELDDLIRAEAIRRGASFIQRLAVRAPLLTNGVVGGATFDGPDGATIAIGAPITLLATGAAAEPLKRFGVCQRIAPSATAARVYVRADEPFARAFEHLCISYDRAICPGYGWIFPGPDRVFNVGVGYFYDAPARPASTNVRELLETFLRTFPVASELMMHSRPLTALRGAPLRTAMTGATLAVSGLLVVGEAAGLTYSFSGEGIGKAIESATIAADVVLRAVGGGGYDPAAAAHEYSTRLRTAFATKFRAYKIAQDWLSRPAIADLLAWRASRSRFVQRALEGMFQETVDPRELFSVAGMIRAHVL